VNSTLAESINGGFMQKAQLLNLAAFANEATDLVQDLTANSRNLGRMVSASGLGNAS
jgi:hypothetical protein